MRRTAYFLFTFAILCSFSFFSSNIEALSKEKQNTLQVVAHTYGTVSCKGTIVVKFLNDAMPLNGIIDKSLDRSPFKFKPSIKGVAQWSDRRTLEFIPGEQLPSGQKYTAKLKLPQSIRVKGEVKKVFKFKFDIVGQAFDIDLHGLKSPDSSRINYQELAGTITTVDFADSDDVEKIFNVTQKGSRLNIKWHHNNQGKVHTFNISGITRNKKIESNLYLKWDGKAIGAAKKGERNFVIPTLDSFKVLQVRAGRGKTQHIEVRFSDILKKDQVLKGLIRAGNSSDGLRFTIDRNIVYIYSSKIWHGNVIIKLDKAIRNAAGSRLKADVERSVSFGKVKPRVRFAGKGVIYPTNPDLSIPIEAVNINAVTIKATRITEDNIPQFLQVNNLDGQNQMNRVGSVIWEKTIDLGMRDNQKDQWIRYGLDVAPLIEKNPGGLFRLELSFDRRHIVFDCPGSSFKASKKSNTALSTDSQEEESSYWDAWEESQGYNYNDYYDNRKNPCHPAYYRRYWDHNIKVSRNILVSDIGLIAKQGSSNELFIAATDIKSAQPLKDIDLFVYNYQNELISKAKSDSQGVVTIDCESKPYLIVAQKDGQNGYLRLDHGQALSMSHFDTSGARIKQGLKGFLYGERGVWRPGDSIYLTFILLDLNKKLPKDHPVIFELRNSKNQLVKRVKKTQSKNGFFSVKFDTDQDAPTGNWNAKVKIGGVTFEKNIKVETVMPNRLKVNLDFGKNVESIEQGLLKGNLSSTWLHGAVAKNLKADVKLAFTTGKTTFPKYSEYIFDDPASKYRPEKQDIFEGTLDEKGMAAFEAETSAQSVSPGMLKANFTTRIFEPGGAFSIDRYSIPYHPYKRYVGVRLPKGDKARGMLLTDTEHLAQIAMVDTKGNPVPKGEVKVELYKVKWRWWWAKGNDAIADYIGRSSYRAIQRDVLKIKNGKAEWKFQIKYPSWGRYFVRVYDNNGRHSTGKITYIDWPGWAGRSTDNTPSGASVLNFSADKESYKVGEKVILTIPTGKKGRGLVSCETGSSIVKTDWFEADGKASTRFEFIATKEMAPNVYVNVTFLQPHMQTSNDLPIRMYGVIPVKVFNPATLIKPKITCLDVFVPGEAAMIKVAEEAGNSMTYTLAIVDDGLLDLTRFKTPDPWNHFYKRESLGIKTWDLYNYVVGAYGGTLENLLAIGGDESLSKGENKKANRFPPMVRFIGPFDLEKGKTNTHKVDVPQYLGSVRVMAVAGSDRAFGFDEKNVFVRKPLMILGTLPRVIGPEEEVSLPISVFAMEKKIKKVEITVTANDLISVDGSDTKTLSFTEPGDQIVSFKIKAGFLAGIGKVTMTAKSGKESVEQTIELDVRIPSKEVTDVVNATLLEDEKWEQDISMPGITGTNSALLEVSRIPPLDLSKRLQYLIRYPHGCVEQTTSSVFPQLYLGKLLKLSSDKQDKIQRNITAGINRLRTFQTQEGGFGYWPGSGESNAWCSNYAGHFLVEAKKAGYAVPVELLDDWKMFQRNEARLWTTGSNRSGLIQAYRLYTLALSGAPELGAMNRLREEQAGLSIPVRWRLAAAYQLAGQPEAAHFLIRNAEIDVKKYRELSNTYGSDIRDKAMILESLCLLDRRDKAGPLVYEISEVLSNGKWLGTQTTAYSLIAMATYAGVSDKTKKMEFDLIWNGRNLGTVLSLSPILQQKLDVDDNVANNIQIVNKGDVQIYPRLILTGIPPVGSEQAAANGMSLNVRYYLPNGEAIDTVQLSQGTDFIAEVTIKNIGRVGKYEEVALTHIFPSGWEIHNTRMDSDSKKKRKNADFEYQDIRDDRVYTYFDIKQGEKKVFKILLNASYLGKYYQPMVSAETMYDAAINARIPGQWVGISREGENKLKEKDLQ
jgi:alpha-2-macroglobulin